MFSLYVFNIYSFVLSVMDSFVCDKCGKKFTAKTNLTRHEKTHTKENQLIQLIRDLENKHFNDQNHFKTNKRKRKLSI